jgi:hypothetical protein
MYPGNNQSGMLADRQGPASRREDEEETRQDANDASYSRLAFATSTASTHVAGHCQGSGRTHARSLGIGKSADRQSTCLSLESFEAATVKVTVVALGLGGCLVSHHRPSFLGSLCFAVCTVATSSSESTNTSDLGRRKTVTKNKTQNQIQVILFEHGRQE